MLIQAKVIKLEVLSFPIFVNMKLDLLISGSVLPHLPENTGKGDQWPEDRSAQILDAHDKNLILGDQWDPLEGGGWMGGEH